MAFFHPQRVAEMSVYGTGEKIKGPLYCHFTTSSPYDRIVCPSKTAFSVSSRCAACFISQYRL
jgi:hypothetical protein